MLLLAPITRWPSVRSFCAAASACCAAAAASCLARCAKLSSSAALLATLRRAPMAKGAGALSGAGAVEEVHQDDEADLSGAGAAEDALSGALLSGALGAAEDALCGAAVPPFGLSSESGLEAALSFGGGPGALLESFGGGPGGLERGRLATGRRTMEP